MSDYRSTGRNSPSGPNPQKPAASPGAMWAWGAGFLILAFIFVLYMLVDGQLRLASKSETPTTTVERQSSAPNQPTIQAR